MTLFRTAAAVIAISLPVGMASAGEVPATFHAGGAKVHHVAGRDLGLTVLYDQSGDDAENAIVSMNNPVGSGEEQYNSQGADDFTIPDGQRWRINEVDVVGVDYGSLTSVNVYFYKNDRHTGKPGKLTREYDNVPVKDSNGSFAIPLPRGINLQPGTHWVSVVANMNSDFWYWEIQNGSEGLPALWQNPSDGFGTGCTTWGDEGACTTYPGDHIFTLRGSLLKAP